MKHERIERATLFFGIEILSSGKIEFISFPFQRTSFHRSPLLLHLKKIFRHRYRMLFPAKSFFHLIIISQETTKGACVAAGFPPRREQNASRLVVLRWRRGTGVLTPRLHDIVALSSLTAVAFDTKVRVPPCNFRPEYTIVIVKSSGDCFTGCPAFNATHCNCLLL